MFSVAGVGATLYPRLIAEGTIHSVPACKFHVSYPMSSRIGAETLMNQAGTMNSRLRRLVVPFLQKVAWGTLWLFFLIVLSMLFYAASVLAAEYP